jgi:hypothetical protein
MTGTGHRAEERCGMNRAFRDEMTRLAARIASDTAVFEEEDSVVSGIYEASKTIFDAPRCQRILKESIDRYQQEVKESIDRYQQEAEEALLWQEGDRSGDPALWDRYFHKLVNVARDLLPTPTEQDLPGSGRPESLVHSVLNAFINGRAAKHYPVLNEPGDLWMLLVEITLEKYKKRKNIATTGLDPQEIPTVEMAEEFNRTCAHLLGKTQDDVHQVFVLKLQRFNDEEICERMDTAPTMVDQALEEIQTNLRLYRDAS